MHVFDPARFPYGADTHYAPMAQEMGTAAQLDNVLATYGTRHALNWPHLRAPMRVDYGVLLGLLTSLFPDATQRRQLVWDTPRELFSFIG